MCHFLAVRMSGYTDHITEFVESPVTITLHGQESFQVGVITTTINGVYRIHTEQDSCGSCVKRVREHLSLVLEMIPYTKAEHVSFKCPLFPTIHVPVQEWETGAKLVEKALRIYGF